MAGRDLFAKLAPVINLGVACLRLLPASVVAGSWWIVEYLPGKLGIGIRYMFAKRLCRECGDNVLFGTGVFVDHWDKISIGRNVTIHRGCYVDGRGSISIGDNVSIAHATSLVAFEHTWDDASTPIKYNELSSAPIEIHADVWIGCGVRILSGVTIGSRTVVAAGAVVARGSLENGVYGGVPAKRLKEFSLEPLGAAT